jgi:hypothetical protein
VPSFPDNAPAFPALSGIADGTPDHVRLDPATPFIYDFIGRVSRFRGAIRRGRGWHGDVVVGMAGRNCRDRVAVYV